MDNKEITFEQTFTPVSLVKFALPSVLVSVFTSLYPLVDGYFIKEYAGEKSRLAWGICIIRFSAYLYPSEP